MTWFTCARCEMLDRQLEAANKRSEELERKNKKFEEELKARKAIIDRARDLAEGLFADAAGRVQRGGLPPSEYHYYRGVADAAYALMSSLPAIAETGAIIQGGTYVK